MQANRNGFLYTLDRKDGKFLGAVQFVENVNWASRIAESGRPVLTGIVPTRKGARICPGVEGATNWYSPSFNPGTGLFYFLSLERCHVYFTGDKRESYRPGSTYYNTGTKRVPGEAGQKKLLAFDPGLGKIVWKYSQVGEGDSWGEP